MIVQLRTIIAGSRTLLDPDLIEQAVDACSWFPKVVLCGGAAGIDSLGKAWAESLGILVEMYRADWNKHGRAAGPIRNEEMARNAEALIAVWDGRSRGTADILYRARARDLRVFALVV